MDFVNNHYVIRARDAVNLNDLEEYTNMIREAGYDIFNLPLPESLIEYVKRYERIDYVCGTGAKARVGIDRGMAYDYWVKAYMPVSICGLAVQNTARSLFYGCNCLYDIDPYQVRKETLVRAKEDMEAKIKNLNSSLRFSKKLLKAAELGLDSKTDSQN
jgi:hypothetical protein